MTDINQNLEDAYNIANHIINLIDSEPNVKCIDSNHFKDGPNPFYNQMESGLILEAYYGSMSKIYTSIGEWNIIGSTISNNNGWDNIRKQLENDLGLELIQECVQTKMGYFGPYWKITKFKNKILPEAIKRNDNNIEYQESKEIWKRFKQEKNIE